MIHGLANKMASVFVVHGESSEENKDIYVYACEAIISAIVNVFVALLISLMFGRVVEGFIFISTFALLRSYTGGYHAETHLNCIIMFNVLLSLAISFLSFGINTTASLVISTISLIGIYCLSPIDHENKPLDDIMRSNVKKTGSILAVALWMFCIIDLLVLNIGMDLVVSISMFSVLGSIIVAKANNQASFREEGFSNDNNG